MTLATPTCPDPLASPHLARLLPGLREALDAEAVRPRLQAALFARRGRHVIDRCRPGKVLYAGPDDCRLRYALDARDARTGLPWSATLVGRVFSTPAAGAAYARERVTPVAARMVGRAEAEPFDVPVAEVGDLALVVHPFPVDPALPTLVEATDPRIVADILRTAGGRAGRDRAAPRPTVRVVRYPRRARCVLRYVADGHRPVYAKVYAGGQGSLVRPALSVLKSRPARPGLPALLTPEWLGYLPELRLTLLGELPGTPVLPPLLRAAAGGDAGAWSRAREEVTAAAGALAAVHACAAPPGRPRTLAADLAALSCELSALRQVDPAFAGWAAARLERLAAAAAPPAPKPCCAHGDYTPSQLLADGGSLGLVDVDTLCLAEPALDVGQFLAYLRVALSAADPGPAAGLGERFVEAYVDAAGLGRVHARVLRDRARVYQAASLVRVAVRGWLQLKGRRVRAALTALSQEGL